MLRGPLKMWTLYGYLAMLSMTMSDATHCSRSIYLEATTVSKTLRMTGGYPGYSAICWYIKESPRGSWTSQYYLEIVWTSFSVQAEMPSCSSSNVEVYVTSSKRSLGKFCSANTKMVTPFNMYSSDGYAIIEYHKASSSSDDSFSLRFSMKRKYGSYSVCQNSLIAGNVPTGVVFSPAWPGLSSSRTCYFKIRNEGTRYVKIIFMDLVLRDYGIYCSDSDALQIRGSNQDVDFYNAKTLGRSICRQPSYPIITSYKFVYIRFQGSYSTYKPRRFMAGIVKYGSTSHVSEKKSIAIAAGVSVFVVFLLVAISLLTCYCKKRWRIQRHTAGIVNDGHSVAAIHQSQNSVRPTCPVSSPSVYTVGNSYNLYGSQGQFSIQPHLAFQGAPPPYSEAVSLPGPGGKSYSDASAPPQYPGLPGQQSSATLTNEVVAFPPYDNRGYNR